MPSRQWPRLPESYVHGEDGGDDERWERGDACERARPCGRTPWRYALAHVHFRNPEHGLLRSERTRTRPRTQVGRFCGGAAVAAARESHVGVMRAAAVEVRAHTARQAIAGGIWRVQETCCHQLSPHVGTYPGLWRLRAQSGIRCDLCDGRCDRIVV